MEKPAVKMPNEIFIENLPLKVDASMLINIFKREGRIISCNIDVDNHLDSLGKGCIIFDNPSSAHHAVKIMDGQSFHGGKLKVSLKPSDDSEDENAVIDNYTKVFVKNIPPHWDDYDLMAEFRKFGGIKAAQISMTKGKSNYFGFVMFNTHSSAKAAVMSKYLFLVVKPYIPKPIRNKTTSDAVEDILKRSTQYNNLYVKNIPEDMDDSALEGLFEKFGAITSVKVARDAYSGKSLKFGFVCFVSEMDAEEALSAMNGYSLNSKQLVVNFHQKKDARKQYLEKRHSDGGFESKDMRREPSVEKKGRDLESKGKDLQRFVKDAPRNVKDIERNKKDFQKFVKDVSRNVDGMERKERDLERKEKDFQKFLKDVTRNVEGRESEKPIERKGKDFKRKEKSTKRDKGNTKKGTDSSKP